jgi:galactoside 2-L-fucosyltransferase 1/2
MIRGLFAAPNLKPELRRAFTFRDEHQSAAEATINAIADKFTRAQAAKRAKKGKKPLKKPKERVFVGIHSRRTDHVSYENARGRTDLKPSYFLQAMDLFREHFQQKLKKDVVFVYVSDDLEWGKKHVLPRVGSGDLFLAGEGLPDSVDSIGHDMAVLAACNHTIMTYGTFGFWSAFLAGGSVVLPQHFPEYG